MKNVLIISASPRKNGNSDILCDRFAQGAKESGHKVEKIFLASKKIGYCRGCCACISTHRCAQKDDMPAILEQMLQADAIVLATPVYFYSVDGQMKTFIDRAAPIYQQLKNIDFYFIMTATDPRKEMMARTVETFRGCTEDCIEGAREAGIIYGTGVRLAGEVKNSPAYEEAYQMGKNLT